MTTIREFTDPVLAGLILSFLQDSGVDAVLLDEGASAWSGSQIMVPVRLQVADEQVEEAARLLIEFDAAPPSA